MQSITLSLNHLYNARVCKLSIPFRKFALWSSFSLFENVYPFIKANASSYTVESSSEIQIDMIYWQKMLHWLTVHHFDDHKEQAKDHAKWVVIVWELAGITPTNLKSEIIGHQQTIGKFITLVLQEMLYWSTV